MGRNGEGRYLLHVLARPWFWGLIGLALVGAVGAYQVRTGYTVDVGGPGDALYVRNFYAPVLDADGSRTYRRTDVYSYVVIPGVGGGAPYSVTLTLNPGQAAGPETIILNGETYRTGKLPAGWQTYTFAVDAQHPHALAARDLVVELRAPPTGGLEVAAVTVGSAGPGLVVPPVLQLAYLAALLVLGYLFVARVQVAAAGAGAARPEPRLPLLLTAAGALLLAVGLATVRLLLAALMLDFVLAALAAHVLLAPVWWAGRRLAGEARIVGRLLARPAPWLLAVLTVAAAIGAWQVRHAYSIDVGSPADQAYMQNFHDRVVDPDGRTYRTSDAYGYVVLPGIGGGVPYSVTLTVRGADSGTPLTVIANGVTLILAAPADDHLGDHPA